MAREDSIDTIQSILRLVHDVAWKSATGFTGCFKKDCTDLTRRLVLLSHLFEEVSDFKGDFTALDSLSDLTAAVKAANVLVLSAGSFDANISPVSTSQTIV